MAVTERKAHIAALSHRKVLAAPSPMDEEDAGAGPEGEDEAGQQGEKRARASAAEDEVTPPPAQAPAPAQGQGGEETAYERQVRIHAERLRAEQEAQARRKILASLKPRMTPADELTIPASVKKICPGQIIGDGAFGHVYLLKDYPDVVIKRVGLSRRERHEPARLRRNRIVMREVDLLRVIGPHPNIICLVRKPILRKHHMDLLLPRYDETLYEYIGVSGVSHARAARIMRQVMAALHACHRVDVIHRDVKPGNILVDRAREQVVLADFGLAKRMVRGRVEKPCETWAWEDDEDSFVSSASDSDADDEPDPAEYTRKHEANKLRRANMRRDEIYPLQEVVTLGYRAPELVEAALSHTLVRYGPEIDVFAAGCIYAELLTGTRTFGHIPSESSADMKQYMKRFENFYAYVEERRHNIRPGQEWLAFTNDEFDVWMPMMARDPAKRCSSERALSGFKLLCTDYAELRFLDCGAA